MTTMKKSFCNLQMNQINTHIPETETMLSVDYNLIKPKKNIRSVFQRITRFYFYILLSFPSEQLFVFLFLGYPQRCVKTWLLALHSFYYWQGLGDHLE